MGEPPRSGPVTQLPTYAATLVTNQRMEEWRLEADEPTLTREANAWAAAQPLVQTGVGTVRLQELRVQLGEDQFVVRGTAESGWIRAPVELTLSASVETGRALVHVRHASVNGLSLPQGVRRDIEQQVQGQLDALAREYQGSVRSVRIAEGQLVVTGSQL
jgi:acetyl/propionyl-CoA carboxylase alpha subunit